MPFTQGTTNTWVLGNMYIAKRAKETILQTKSIKKINKNYCGPCCDKSQINLHHAKALILNCMDFRLRDNTTCHLNKKGYKNEYDEVISAGASLGYNGLSTYEKWDTYIDSHVLLAYDLHDISEIIIVEHEKCGAYKVQYGNGLDLSLEDEYNYHVTNVKQCIDTLWKKFGQDNNDGTFIKQIPNLKIVAYLTSIDASSFKKLYSIE